MESSEKMTFCDEMRKRTKNVHDESDKIINMRLLAALTDTKLYALVLRDFYEVYRVIEDCLNDNRDNQYIHRIWKIVQASLRRQEAFKQDLSYYGFNESQPCSAAAEEYVNRIYEVSKNEPELLIGYYFILLILTKIFCKSR